jgi:hypothetical protein
MVHGTPGLETSVWRQESHDDLTLISAAFAAQFLADFAQREIIGGTPYKRGNVGV